LPRVIEAFDISNIHGVLAVGSMVTFKDGKPLKSRYRRFKVRSVQGIDDFAMMEEVLSRRFESIKAGKDMAPDLILIDGGKGQVSAAVKAMLKNEISSIPIIGLAKKEELVFMPGKKEGLRLERSSDALKLLQRLRDEAHRFAVSYHRKLRSKELQSSILDRIPGIGKSKRTVLLNAFGSVEKIKEASIDQLVSVPGIGDRLAEEIYRFIHKN
ncbi:excinuclease ABC subunit C, partial [bacterium]